MPEKRPEKRPNERSPESRLASSSASQTGSLGSLGADHPLNPGIRPEELSNEFPADSNPRPSPRTSRETRGSGSDKNSDTSRLKSPDALLDKTDEDTFPASDPPSYSPITGIGPDSPTYGDEADVVRRGGGASPSPDTSDPEDVAEFKNDPKRQFQYGRKAEASTLHFEPSTNRLNKGNPDVGDVDLGTIEADKPAQPDDLDPYDSADDDDERGPSKDF